MRSPTRSARCHSVELELSDHSVLAINVVFEECVKGMFLYEGRCEAACPEKHFSTLNEESQAICSYCHYTCNACSGPNDYECISCYGDALLKHMSKSESYCYPKALLPVMETSKWFYWMFIAFAANVTAFVLILVYFVFYKLIKNSYCYKTDHHYSKMKNDANELDTKSVLYNSSDSENDL
ncbi:hypothetical protein C0J52_15496 [Blattella germanica]|nr:hypothetical protein C0J52_15496 [Blattella germanica]